MYRRILAAIDCEDEIGTALILKRCASLARMCEARTSLVHVRLRLPEAYSRHFVWYSEVDLVRELKASLRDLAREHGLEDCLSNVHVPAGSIAREVIRTAEDERADVIVMAAHAMTIGRIVLGSNAHAIMRDAPCDVLVAKTQQMDR